VNVETGVTQAERLARVSEILIELFRSPVPTHFFQTLGDQAMMAVPCDYLAVCLHDQENGGYLVHSLVSLDAGGAIGQRAFAPGEGLPGMVMSTGTARLVADLGATDVGALDLEGALATAGLRAALVVPIRRGLEVLGALFFAGRPPIAYGDDDLQVAYLLAAGLSAALETSLAYQAAADERSTLGAVLASTSDAVIMTNPAGLVLLANAAVRPMLGLVPDAITGRPLLDVVDYAPLRDLFVAAKPGISELPLPDGRTAQASVVPVATPFGEPVGVAAVLRDITLLKNLEQMKSDFVNTVSHDLKGPITVIAGMADLMRMAGPADPDHESRCQDIRDSAQHMADLVTDLLDIGKIEAGLDSAREPIDLVPVIGEALRMVKPRAEPKRIELVAELVDEAIISAVPSRIRQVLINLLDNGVKYTPAGGRVTISAALSRSDAGGASAVIVRVRDTGIGIPAKDLPHVFDKFYRVKSKATSEIAGTGLGLAITRSIVEAYEGRIRVESVEGAGTTFVVEIPLVGA
jgi:two-component system, OmpR family, phosphate regulon sensor histidine kinase PhoR